MRLPLTMRLRSFYWVHVYPALYWLLTPVRALDRAIMATLRWLIEKVAFVVMFSVLLFLLSLLWIAKALHWLLTRPFPKSRQGASLPPAE